MPLYDDITGGLPPDWQPDPAWVPPPHWGYGALEQALPIAAPPPELVPVDALQPGIGAPLAVGGLEDAAAAPVEQALPPEQAPAAAPPPPIAEAPPLPMPDAITGADLGAPPPIEPERFDLAAEPVTIADEWARDPLHGPDAKAYVENASLADLYDQQRKIDTARQTKLLLDQARTDEENLRQIKINTEARRVADAETAKKMEQIVADATGLAKVDPDRLMSRMSGGQTFAQILSLAVGGLVAGRTGGPNVAMDLFQKRLDRDIDAQKADIENAKYGIGVRQGAVAQEYARTGNLFQAAETVRAATYQAAINKMQTEQQNFDPAGTAWVRYGLQIKDAAARQAASIEKAGAEEWERSHKTKEQILKQQAQAEAARHNRATEGLERAKANAAKGPALSPEVWRTIHPDNPVPPIAMTEREYGQFLEQRKAGQELKNRSLGTTNVIPGITTKGPDGKEKPFVAVGTAEQLDKTRSKVAASTTIVDLLNQAKRIRTGYSSNSDADRAEWLKLQQIWGTLQAKGKDALGLGAMSETEYELMGKYLGAADPTTFRDPTEGINQAIRSVELDLNNELRSRGFEGVHKIPDTSQPPPSQRTAQDKALDSVLRGSSGAKDTPFTPTGEIKPPVARVDTGTLSPRDAAMRLTHDQFVRPYQEAERFNREQIDRWGAELASPDPAVRDNAANKLASVAGTETETGSTEGALREYARQKLLDNVSRSIFQESP